ncbi:uncharacterized protein LOC107784327 isoform X2 [Nicotiana tabacum]|uniref:Uncharacterized protein LOC107784327 isoform X2 n=2 Tax=Nicotiana TaxID=4085 RepID=A0A1S3Z9Q0_TOBAC|nr:PREDICTED: uncharacterized protein LOC107784327 isoform X2 [Nicotiana tabacum]
MPQTFQSTHVIEETPQPQYPMVTMINDAFGFIGNNVNEPGVSCEPMNSEERFNEEHNEEYAQFYELVEDGNQPLYEGEDKGLQECKKYKTSRWKDNKKKQPAKILCYFPLKPRLQRLFMCSKTVESMRCHSSAGNQDGLMRHPRDSQAWKAFDLLHPEFAVDPRNKKQGKEVDRGKVWTETHRRKDGSYVNVQAREIGERIEEIRRQRPENRAEISPNDALGVIFGPEHPGRVRGLGMGAVPTVVFKQTSRRGGGSYMGAASTSAPPPQWVQEMANMRSRLNALTSLFQMKIGNIPRSLLTYFRLLHRHPI